MTQLTSGILAEMSKADLKAALASAQNAYIEVMSGAKGVSFSYTQGDGTRSVAYQATSPAQLTMLIMQIKRTLNPEQRQRRAVRFRF